ncbi:MAG: MFS transporter [Candidatus Limnocylindrales bacterium]
MDALRRYALRFSGFEPDAQRFLLVTLAYSAALSLFWIDFNLYLSALGVATAVIGLIATGVSLVGAIAAIPAGLLADRLGRRWVLIAGTVLVALAFGGFAVVDQLAAIAILALVFGIGQQAVGVSTIPFMTEHSSPEQRNELFSLQFAIGSFTNVAAAVLGSVVATAIAGAAGADPEGPFAYRVVMGLMFLLTLVALALLLRIGRDRPAKAAPHAGLASFAGSSRAVSDRRLFVKLLLPGFLTALGAGQVIPFLNLFVQGKFGLDLSAINALFAVTGLGTMVAILIQPALARRFGRMGSVVLVQGASLPFLVVLGFSPVLATVVVAMAVRNSLMNAANPIFNAFAMDQVRPSERALLVAGMSLLWSVGWAIAGPWFSLLQATLGFTAGFTVNFVTILGLYTTATALYWWWFGRAERAARRAGRDAAGPMEPGVEAVPLD